MKYELVEKTKLYTNDSFFYRVRALIDIPVIGIKKGDLGGWVNKYGVLDNNEKDISWIFKNCIVYSSGSENWNITNNTLIKGKTVISETAIRNSVIDGNIHIINSDITHSVLKGRGYIYNTAFKLNYNGIFCLKNGCSPYEIISLYKNHPKIIKYRDYYTGLRSYSYGDQTGDLDFLETCLYEMYPENIKKYKAFIFLERVDNDLN